MSINYYVLTDDDCKYEAMTKEQTITAIEQAVENGVVSDPDGAVISKIKEIRANGIAQIWLGTEAQFNALSPAPSVGYTFVRVGANGIMYIWTDDQTSSNMLNHATNKNNPHQVTAAQIGAVTTSAMQTALNGKANTSHTQSASTITAGTLAGEVKANGNAEKTLSSAQVRNIHAGTADLQAGTSALTTGEVYVVYE